MPAVLLRLARKDVRACPADPLALGRRPEWVLAFGFADALDLDEAGTFFDGFVRMARPDRGADPIVLVGR